MATKNLLASLQGKVPNGRSHFSGNNPNLDKARTLVRLHVREIEEARSQGYSWSQIEEAFNETYCKGFNVSYRKNKDLICFLYYELKKELSEAAQNVQMFNISVSKA